MPDLDLLWEVASSHALVTVGARADQGMAATPPPVKINPAEALIVVTGIEPFLRHTSRDLGGAIVRSEQLPETLSAKIYRFLNREEREAPSDLPPFDFDEVVALLEPEPEDVDHDQIEKTIAAFGGQHQLALDVGTEVTRIDAYLRQQIPRRQHVGLDGVEKLPPARSELFRFRRCWSIAERPMLLFDELQEYAVSRDQVQCFATMFPTTFKALWPITQEAMVRKKSASEGWQLPRQKETLLRVLNQQEAQSLALARALAPVYAQEQQAAAQREAKRSTAGAAMGGEATPVQKLDAAS